MKKGLGWVGDKLVDAFKPEWQGPMKNKIPIAAIC